MIMKKRIIIVALLVWGLPTSAANNDIVLNSGTQISINSVTLTVSGSQASAMTVNANDFEVSMPTGSTIEVSAGGLRRLTYTASVNTLTANNDCSSDRSKLTITNNDSGTVSVTISLGTGTCGDGGTTGSGGGGGIVSSGGGGGGYIPTVTPSSPSTLVPLTPVLVPLTGLGTAISDYVFARSLFIGVSGPDVKELQRVLALDLALYPEGNMSGYFGGLTQKAVQRFQVKYGIAGAGQQGYGVFGPASRARFSAVYGSVTPTPVSVVSSGEQLSLTLKRGMTHGQVKLLQTILNKDPETQVSTSDAGSAGMETEFFGAMTEKAVMRFQAKYGIETIGLVGPMTRAKLNSL